MKWFLVLLIFLSSHVVGQSVKKEAEDPSQLGITEIMLEANAVAPSSIKFPFKQIEVLDSRFDTSKFGFKSNPIGGKKNAYKAMQLKGGLSSALEQYYRKYYENSFDQSNFTLFIVIKKFWSSEVDYESNKQKIMYGSREGSKKIRCKFEYYLKKDEKYLPLKRIDTAFVWNENLRTYVLEEFDEKKQQFLKFSLKAMIEVIDFDNAPKAFTEQSGKSLADIITFNKRRLDLPVLKDSNVAKGVFVNFEEFKNNKPGIVSFEEREMKYNVRRTEHYIDDSNGNSIGAYWGYSNGEFIKFGKFVNNKVFRKQDAFYFFMKAVSYNYSDSQMSAGPYTLNSSRKTRDEIWMPFQIDMETGEIY